MSFPGFQSVRPASPFSLTRPSCLQADLQGITMHAEGDSLYGLSALEGWGGGGATRGGVEDYREADGGYSVRVDFTGRSIRVEGSINARDHEGFWEAAERVQTVLTSPREDWLVVHERHLSVARQIRVHRATPPMVTPLSDQYGIFTLDLRSVGYPRLSTTESELSLQVGGSGRATNEGTYPGDYIVELVGPLTNPRLTWSNAFWWQYQGTVPSGETRLVDFTKRFVRNPANGVREDTRGTGVWPQVDPGYRTVALTGSGSGSAVLRWRSAWA